jgi:DNA-binding IclR family transcriptional regulator
MSSVADTRGGVRARGRQTDRVMPRTESKKKNGSAASVRGPHAGVASSASRQVPALVRAKRMLDHLSVDGRAEGVSELARALGLPKSTIHGLCKTLADLGILARVGSAQFSIGPHVLAWANAFQSQNSLVAEFQRLTMGRRAILKDESLNLSVLSGNSVLYVACRNGSSPLGLSFRTGMSLPAVFTATGKAMLSTFPIEDVQELLGGSWPKPFSRSSVRSFKAFRHELDEVRRRGYSIDNGQLREGMFCFGAPVFAAGSDRAIAGIAVGLLTVEVTGDTAARYGADVQRLAAELSRRLGAPRPPDQKPDRGGSNDRADRQVSREAGFR